MIAALPDDVRDILSPDRADQLADVFASRLAAEWLDGFAAGIDRAQSIFAPVA